MRIFTPELDNEAGIRSYEAEHKKDQPHAEYMTAFSVQLTIPKCTIYEELAKSSPNHSGSFALFYQHSSHQAEVKYIEPVIFAEVACLPVCKLRIGSRKQPPLQ